MILLAPPFAWAEMPQYLCMGGVTQGNVARFLDLSPKDSAHPNEWRVELPSSRGTVEFRVQMNPNDFLFQAQLLESHRLLIDEMVSALPAVRSIVLSEGEEVSIQCRLFSWADYCRNHTC